MYSYIYTIAKKKRHEMYIFRGRVKGKERNGMVVILIIIIQYLDVRFVEVVQLIFLSNIRGSDKSINAKFQDEVFTTTFRCMHRMYYICIIIHTYGLVKYNM